MMMVMSYSYICTGISNPITIYSAMLLSCIDEGRVGPFAFNHTIGFLGSNQLMIGLK